MKGWECRKEEIVLIDNNIIIDFYRTAVVVVLTIRNINLYLFGKKQKIKLTVKLCLFFCQVLVKVRNCYHLWTSTERRKNLIKWASIMVVKKCYFLFFSWLAASGFASSCFETIDHINIFRSNRNNGRCVHHHKADKFFDIWNCCSKGQWNIQTESLLWR